MKVLVTGANGQLGQELRARCEKHAGDFVFTDFDELNICDQSQVSSVVKEVSPDVLINCAAYTAVDRAESEIDLAMELNATAPKNLAEVCADRKILLIHFSTDFVFDGDKSTPYLESDPTNPLSQYGLTKKLGEDYILKINSKAVIIRTSWLYSEFGNNFVKTMLKLLARGEEFGVVNDQIGSPTYAGDLAEMVLGGMGKFMELGGAEIFHYSNEGAISWYDFAMAIRRLSGSETPIRAISTAEYPTAACRPAYSVLGKGKVKQFLGVEVRGWELSLRQQFAFRLQSLAYLEMASG